MRTVVNELLKIAKNLISSEEEDIKKSVDEMERAIPGLKFSLESDGRYSNYSATHQINLYEDVKILSRIAHFSLYIKTFLGKVTFLYLCTLDGDIKKQKSWKTTYRQAGNNAKKFYEMMKHDVNQFEKDHSYVKWIREEK